MLALPEHQQAAFIGVRTTFYRIATIAAKGGLVILAGYLETHGFTVTSAWSVTFLAAATVFLAFCIYHAAVLPRPVADRPAARDPSQSHSVQFLQSLSLFFRQKNITAILAFLLLYRFAEAQLVKMVAPFLLDPRAKGGLGLTTSEVGIVYGTVGVMALMLGGLVGGYVISRQGLKFWIWIMACAMHLPDLIFVYLSHALPQSFWIVNLAVALEQFGYGFGFTAYTMVMIMISDGPYKTVSYAIATGIMALGMMIPAMFSGWIQEQIGYPHFFLWIILSTVPGFAVVALIRIDPEFGMKRTEKRG